MDNSEISIGNDEDSRRTDDTLETLMKSLEVFGTDLISIDDQIPIIYEGYHRNRDINKSFLKNPDVYISHVK